MQNPLFGNVSRLQEKCLQKALLDFTHLENVRKLHFSREHRLEKKPIHILKKYLFIPFHLINAHILFLFYI